VGFENVFEPSALAGGAPGSFRSWLRQRVGGDGVAFASPDLPGRDGSDPIWEGKVRSVRPTPQGITIEVVADELMVTLRMPSPVTPPLPTLGERVAFRIDPASLRPLRAAGGRGPGG